MHESAMVRQGGAYIDAQISHLWMEAQAVHGLTSANHVAG